MRTGTYVTISVLENDPLLRIEVKVMILIRMTSYCNLKLVLNLLHINTYFIIISSQVMIRSRLLRENGKYLPKQSFAMRRHWFNNEETGYFKVQKRAPASQVTSY